jgi:succinylglutamate desuccinylase
MNRLIGKYTGEAKGPLLICIGGIHGNEHAGIKALDLMFKMLEVEPITNPSFKYKGRIIGIVGNVKACEAFERFIDVDLNRIWTKEIVDRVMSSNEKPLCPEEEELKGIMETIRHEIDDYQPEEIYLLDLHTTSSFGGIFTIACDDPKSVEIAIGLHAPVIKGMLNGIYGTTLHYFTTENFGIPTTAVLFESGQHYEELSVNRAIAAITNYMRGINSINPDHVENRHDEILIEYSRNLPKVAELVSRYEITPGDQFKMMPDYNNFQAVKAGEVIAKDKKGDIKANADALILMPLYQDQGEDGFFLIRKIEGY